MIKRETFNHALGTMYKVLYRLIQAWCTPIVCLHPQYQLYVLEKTVHYQHNNISNRFTKTTVLTTTSQQTLVLFLHHLPPPVLKFHSPFHVKDAS